MQAIASDKGYMNFRLSDGAESTYGTRVNEFELIPDQFRKIIVHYYGILYGIEFMNDKGESLMLIGKRKIYKQVIKLEHNERFIGVKGKTWSNNSGIIYNL